jgi:hypothetical protein
LVRLGEKERIPTRRRSAPASFCQPEPSDPRASRAQAVPYGEPVALELAHELIAARKEDLYDIVVQKAGKGGGSSCLRGDPNGVVFRPLAHSGRRP